MQIFIQFNTCNNEIGSPHRCQTEQIYCIIVIIIIKKNLLLFMCNNKYV